jgi:hypothetical protein
MALITPGPMVSAASGRVGGTIFSHNRGGAYVRNGALVDKVLSDAAVLQKNTLAATSKLWAGLTAAQRQAWSNYAVDNPVVNRLGMTKTLHGIAAFNAINSRLVRLGLSPLSAPLNGATPAAPGGLVLTIAFPIVTASLAFTPTPVVANTHVMIWACVAKGPQITFLANRWRWIKTVAAAGTSPAAIMTELALRCGTITAGQVVHIRAQLLNQTTGLVSAFTETSTVAPAA